MIHGGTSGGIQSGIDQLSQLAGGGNEELWNKLEAPALRQFGQLQGNIASRFSGMGSGARRSSGFAQSQNSAATDLAERLQGNRMGLQQQAIQDLLGLGKTLLGTQTQENMLAPKQKSFWEELLPSLLGGIAQGGTQAGGLATLKKLGLLGL
jgi:hypothetical protein